jgi:OmpA-OmpF porin, OOP family
MKKLNKVAMLFASVALAAPVASFAQSGAAAKSVDNWRATDGTVWKNGTNELCWRNSSWTPATASAECDGALKPPAPPAPVSEKVTFAADAFFDFDKAVLKPEAQAKLADLVDKTKGVNLEVIIAVGHTDSVGSDAYNNKLSVARADAVKNFLTSKGVEKNRVYTEGKGEASPVADNKTSEGRAKNRRVEVEVVGTRARK